MTSDKPPLSEVILIFSHIHHVSQRLQANLNFNQSALYLLAVSIFINSTNVYLEEIF